MSAKIRTGIGYDAHPLAAGRTLVLGGVKLPFGLGLEGWSDADVLTHAVIDALLGAAALGDIGQHFPPGDPEYKDVSSLALLAEAGKNMAAIGWRVVNIDATVLADEPVLKDYIPLMRENLARVMNVDINCVSVKAGSGNGLGYVGRGEGIAALAVALIEGGSE